MTYTPVSIHIPTLMGHGRQTDIACKLLSIAERAVEDFTRKDSGEIVANAIDVP